MFAAPSSSPQNPRQELGHPKSIRSDHTKGTSTAQNDQVSLWRRNRCVAPRKEFEQLMVFTEAGCAECYVLSVESYACAKWYENMWKRTREYLFFNNQQDALIIHTYSVIKHYILYVFSG